MNEPTTSCHLSPLQLPVEMKQARGAQRAINSCWSTLDCVKLELLVIADQHAAVNTFPGLVHTARHTMRVGNTRSP